MKRKLLSVIALLLVVVMSLTSCQLLDRILGNDDTPTTGGPLNIVVNGEKIPSFDKKAYVNVNGGVPTFTEEEITTKSYEFYSELDSLGRCGVTHACIGVDLMPTEDREEIGSVTPSL